MRILGIAVTDPVTITEFQPPTRFALTHDGTFKGGGVFDLEVGRGRDDDDRALGRDDHPAGPAAPWRDGRPAGPVGSIFQADLERLRDLVEDRTPEAAGTDPAAHPTRRSDTGDAPPPRRRHVRAVPGPLRAAPAGPGSRRDPALGRVRAVRPAAVPAARAGRDARRMRHGPSHRIAAQRPLPGLQVVRGHAARTPCPVPHRRGRDRGARARPLADGRIRGRRRDRRGGRPVRRRSARSSGSSSARRTRTWPSSSATTGSCCGTGAATSPTTMPASARSGACRPPRSPTGSGSSATRRMDSPGSRAGAPSPPPPC